MANEVTEQPTDELTKLDIAAELIVGDPRSRQFNAPNSTRTFSELFYDPTLSNEEKSNLVNTFFDSFDSMEDLERLSPRELLKAAEDRGIRLPEVEAGKSILAGVEPSAYAKAPTGIEWLDKRIGIRRRPTTLELAETHKEAIREKVFWRPNYERALNNPSEKIDYNVPVPESERQPQNIVELSVSDILRRYSGRSVASPFMESAEKIEIELEPGKTIDDLSQYQWDDLVEKIQESFDAEYITKGTGEREGSFKTWMKGFGREAVLMAPSMVFDIVPLLARGVDYVTSPIGTNTLRQDTAAGIRGLFGLQGDRPRPDDPYMDYEPRLLEKLGVYSTEYPNALFTPNVEIEPARVLAPKHHDFGLLLDKTLRNMDMPDLLTPQQETEAQKMAALVGSVMGGSLTAAGAVRAGAKLAFRGMKAEDLLEKGKLQQSLYALANSPGFAVTGKRPSWIPKRLRSDKSYVVKVPGTVPYLAKDAGLAAVAGNTMAIVPEEWGIQGVLSAGLVAPFAAGSAISFAKGLVPGPVNFVKGLTEPFTPGGQRQIASEMMAILPPIRKNPRLVTTLLSDIDNMPKRAGQDIDLTVPDYFTDIAGRLMKAEKDWDALTELGVSTSEVILQLSRDPSYGRYFKDVSVFGSGLPTKEKLASSRMALQTIADTLTGNMLWLQSGSPIASEVMVTVAERSRRAEALIKKLLDEEGFRGEPADVRNYVRTVLDRLSEDASDSMATFAAEGLLYMELRKRLSDIKAVPESAAENSKVAVKAVQNSLEEMRQIESAFWKAIGADEINVSAEQMSKIGDYAAKIILGTDLAVRGKIPPLMYKLAGKTRLLADDAVETMAAAAGEPKVPASIINKRARLAELDVRLRGLKETDPDYAKTQAKIEELQAGVRSLEDQLIPATAADEALVLGTDGLLDGAKTVNEVLSARRMLLEAQATARAKPGASGADTSRIANDAQKYIIEDWLQQPGLFGTKDTSPLYQAAREISKLFHDRFTRSDSLLAKFLSRDMTRAPKNAPEDFLRQLVRDNEIDPNKRPTGSLDAFDAALVKAEAPFFVRMDDGTLAIDMDAGLTPNVENITWTRLLDPNTSSDVILASSLLREELLNQLALIAFREDGTFNQKIVQQAVRKWDPIIARLERDYPGIRSEMDVLIKDGTKHFERSKALEKPLKSDIDQAVISMDVDDLLGGHQASRYVRQVQKDRSIAEILLDRDPRVLAREWIANPDKFEREIPTALLMLKNDDTGSALKGLRRAFFDELTSKFISDPQQAGRRAEQVIDFQNIDDFLVKNEKIARQLFNESVEDFNGTQYDVIKAFNDEALNASKLLRGKDIAKALQIKVPFKNLEVVRWMGRWAGIHIARATGGPQLIMSGTGGRLAQKLYQSSNTDAIWGFINDHLNDSRKFKNLLVDEATLDKKGRFNFAKELDKDAQPHFYLSAGRPAGAIRGAEEYEKEQEDIKRRGGKTTLQYNPETGVIEERRIQKTPPVPAPVTDFERLFRSQPSFIQKRPNPSEQNPYAMLPKRPQPKKYATLGKVSPERLEQARLIDPAFFGNMYAAKNGGYIDAGAGSGMGRLERSKGIMSIKRKGRQLVG